MTHEQVVERIRAILKEEIRLVARPDYAETEAWMVKPGCLDIIAEKIATELNPK